MLADVYPELFSTPLTPKRNEIVAYSHGAGGFEEGKRFFEESLKLSFQEIHRVLKPNGIAVIVYAHKSTEGWETLINSLLDSGLIMTGAWPLDTEMKGRLRAQESAARWLPPFTLSPGRWNANPPASTTRSKRR